jgi:nucleotide-binding universal stress UspA family protein
MKSQRMRLAQGYNLVAIPTHGHSFVADFFDGRAKKKIRHEIDIPLLLVRAGE